MRLIWLITNGILIALLLKSVCEQRAGTWLQFVNLFVYNAMFILILALKDKV